MTKPYARIAREMLCRHLCPAATPEACEALGYVPAAQSVTETVTARVVGGTVTVTIDLTIGEEVTAEMMGESSVEIAAIGA